MPRVPTYQRQMRGERALPSAEMPAPPPSTFGADTGEALANFGQTVTRGGAGLLQIAEQRAEAARRDEERMVQTSLDNQLARARHELLYDPQKGALQAKGQNALTVPDAVAKEWQDRLAKIGEGVKGPRMQAFFDSRAQQHWTQLDEDVQRHVFTERNKWATSEMESGLDLAESDAIAHATDPARVNTALQTGIAKIKDLARFQGAGEAATAAKVETFRTKVHAGVIDQMLANGQDRAAQVYYEETKDQIAGEAQARITKALETASVDGDALRASEDLWVTYGGNLADMEAAARQRFLDDPKRLKATIGFLRERRQGLELAQKDAEDAASAPLMQLVASGVSGQDLVRSRAYINAPAKLQLWAKEKLEQRAEHAENRAASLASRRAAEANRAYTQESHARMRKQWAAEEQENANLYEYYQLRDKVHTLSDDAIWAQMPKIGQANVAKLLKDKRTGVSDPASIDDFRTDTAVLHSVLQRNNIDPSPKDISDKAKVGWFLDTVAAEQRKVQSITKKKLTNAELEAIAGRVLGQQVLDRGWFTNSQQPIMNAKYSDIPPADVAGIRQAFAARGVTTPTEDQILTAWLTAQMGKK